MTSDESNKLLDAISEYVVTDHLEKSFEHLLNIMNLATSGPIDSYGRTVWISGFYGSGKSTFTKYLGFALDQNKMLDGKSFLIHFQDRLCNDSTKALLNVVSKNLNPHVVFLDLAREMSAGSEMLDISAVLRNKVLRDWGYSENIKIAGLELMLDRDGKFEEFKESAKKYLKGASWESVHNMPIISNTVYELAQHFYPNILQNKEELANIRITSSERVQEIIDLVKRKSGKNNIIFILDDVNEYIGTSVECALMFQNLVELLIDLGKGSIWLFATSQVDLSDNRYLSKIAGKFSINVHLESK